MTTWRMGLCRWNGIGERLREEELRIERVLNGWPKELAFFPEEAWLCLVGRSQRIVTDKWKEKEKREKWRFSVEPIALVKAVSGGIECFCVNELCGQKVGKLTVKQIVDSVKTVHEIEGANGASENRRIWMGVCQIFHDLRSVLSKPHRCPEEVEHKRYVNRKFFFTSSSPNYPLNDRLLFCCSVISKESVLQVFRENGEEAFQKFYSSWKRHGGQ